MAQPTLPIDPDSAKAPVVLVQSTGGAAEPVWWRGVEAAVIGAETTKSGAMLVAPFPRTSGGLLVKDSTGQDGSTALTNGAQAIKASAGQLYGYVLHNPNAAETNYVHFYNTASGSVTVGTTNPKFSVGIPPLTTLTMPISAMGIEFTNAGWSWSATSDIAGNTAPTAALNAVAFYA